MAKRNIKAEDKREIVKLSQKTNLVIKIFATLLLLLFGWLKLKGLSFGALTTEVNADRLFKFSLMNIIYLGFTVV